MGKDSYVDRNFGESFDWRAWESWRTTPPAGGNSLSDYAEAYLKEDTHNNVVFSVEEIRGISARFVEDEKHEGHNVIE